MEYNVPQASIKISAGNTLIEYSGPQSFIENGLMEFATSLFDSVPQAITADTSNDTNTSRATANNSGSIQAMSTNTIASVLGAKSGPELVLAAVAHLQLVKGQDRAQRSDILSEMKSATTYYKSTYSSNLSSYLDSLLKAKRLNLIGEKVYALPSSERTKLESALATAD